MSILTLFLTFVKFGLLCFGGGYVLVPLIIQDFVQTRKLFTPEEFGNLLSISQVTPGPIGINTATYVGYMQNGFFGSLVATFSLIFPALILTPLAIISLNKWQDKFVVKDIDYLMKHSSKSIKEIAGELDFPNLSFFGKYVKKHLGVSPRDYRLRLLKET